MAYLRNYDDLVERLTRERTPAEPAKKERSCTGIFASAGVTGGLAAGVILLLALMIYVAAVGSPPLSPIGDPASILMGPGAQVPQGGVAEVLTAIGVGVLMHLAIAVLCGILFAIIMSAFVGSASVLVFGSAGVLFGIGSWLFANFTLYPALFPWLPSASPGQQTDFLIHAIAFGLPLGLWVGRAVQMKQCHGCVHKRIDPKNSPLDRYISDVGKRASTLRISVPKSSESLSDR